MLKNKKGFTLIEMLAIIVLLGIIIGVAAPNITRQINRGEKEKQNVLNEKIENASMIYAAKYYADDLLNSARTTDITFTLRDIQSDGLINLKDNCGGKLDSSIRVDSSGEYIYDNIIDDDCYTKLEQK